MALLLGRWESFASDFRRVCDSVIIYPEKLNVGYNAWNSSQIGTSSSNHRYYGAVSAGVIYTFSQNDFPSINPTYYPTPIVNNDGGWKYDAINPNLPKTLALPNGLDVGYPSDMTFEITGPDRLGRYTSTLTDIEFDDAWTSMLYLRENIGTGAAFTQTVTRTESGRTVRYSGYNWHTTYQGAWCTLYDKDGLDVSQRKYGISAVFLRPGSSGTFKLSDMITSGMASVENNGYLWLSPSGLFSPLYNYEIGVINNRASD